MTHIEEPWLRVFVYVVLASMPLPYILPLIFTIYTEIILPRKAKGKKKKKHAVTSKVF